MNLKFNLNDLILFHSIVYGTSPIKLPDYYISRPTGFINPDTSGRYFQRSTRNTCYFDHLMFKCKTTPKIDAFREDFFYRTMGLWNNLPLDLRETTSGDCFKIKLKEHLWTVEEGLGT